MIKYYSLLFIFLLLPFYVIGQNKVKTTSIDIPTYSIDINKDTLDMQKILQHKDEIIAALDKKKYYIYTEIQGRDSIEWFISNSDINSYTHSKKYPYYILYKSYNNNNRIEKCGYYLKDLDSQYYFGYGVKIGKWKYYNLKGEMYNEKDYDKTESYGWNKALEIAMINLKCNQQDLELSTFSPEVNTWMIFYKNKNGEKIEYIVNRETGHFSKAPKPMFSISIGDIKSTSNTSDSTVYLEKIDLTE